MKKKTILLAVGCLVLAAPAYTIASNFINTLPFDVSLNVNNKDMNLQVQNGQVLNYNGQAYVPVRYLTESLDGLITFDEKKRAINIANHSSNEKTSVLHSSKTVGPFILTIHSSEKAYTYGDKIPDIWATMQYTGKEMISVKHANPTLIFSIEDESGNKTEDFIQLIEQNQILNEQDEISTPLSLKLIAGFNQIKHGYNNADEFLNDHTKPWLLEKGNYIIRVRAGFLADLSVDLNQLSTEIPISVFGTE